MPINFRKANIMDKQALYDLGVMLNRYNLEHDLHENLFWEGWENDIASETEAELTSEHNAIFIAETDNQEAVGYLVVRKCHTCGHYEVDQLFVKEEYRAQKVGKGLMQLAIDVARKDNMPLQLEVYKTNAKAIKFYENLGFTETGILMRMEFD
jgi:ribosomal protein S18 acetylase RimI-like enzyme